MCTETTLQKIVRLFKCRAYPCHPIFSVKLAQWFLLIISFKHLLYFLSLNLFICMKTCFVYWGRKEKKKFKISQIQFLYSDINMLFCQNLDIKIILYKYTNKLIINFISKENQDTKDIYWVWPGCIFYIFHFQFYCLTWKNRKMKRNLLLSDLESFSQAFLLLKL